MAQRKSPHPELARRARLSKDAVRRETGKEQRVQAPYSEGLANHIGPESCAMRREVQGEALAGECAGWAIEPRKSINRGADAVASAEGNTGRHVKRVLHRPCVVEDPSMRRSSVYGNREVSPLTTARAARRSASGRPEG
jgi:hypothetical protein